MVQCHTPSETGAKAGSGYQGPLGASQSCLPWGTAFIINTCELVSNPRLSLNLGGCQIPLAFLEFQGAQGRFVCGEPPKPGARPLHHRMVHWWALQEHRSSKKNLTPRRGIGCQVMMSGPLPGGLSVKGKCGQAGTHSSGWVEGLWARDCLSPAVLSHGLQSTDGPSAAHIWTSCNSGKHLGPVKAGDRQG